MKFKIVLTGFLLVLSLPSLNAQATVGSDIEPRKGSLLDIKQDDESENNPNSNGGLGLPRVKLVAPETLTIDVPSEKDNYVGVMVYNVGNTNIPEGIYYWDGDRWRLSVSVDNFGANGNLLKSNGYGTFSWSNFVLPNYEYHKPTQIGVFDDTKATTKTFTYNNLIGGGDGTYGGKKPVNNTFSDEKAIVYTDYLQLQSGQSSDKYLLLGISATARTATVNNNVIKTGFWQIIQIDVYLGNNLLQSNQRLYPMSDGGDPRVYIDMFSIVPINGIDAGNYPLKIKISNVENSFNMNEGSAGGNFNNTVTSSFYTITMVDINYVLYEDD